eukprot:292962_1
MITVAIAMTCTMLVSSDIIKPYEYASLPVGSILPQGWLQTQLEIQAEGLTGHLLDFWPQVANSSWIQPNISKDPDPWEQDLPYWLNGLIPLHFLLPQNDNLHSQSWKIISFILQYASTTNSKTGWLGVDDLSGGNQYLGRWNVLNALTMYCEGNTTLCSTIKPAILKYILVQQYRMINTAPFGNTWSGARWMDFVYSVMWLIQNGGDIINNYTQNLTDIMDLSYEQGFDWETWFEYQLPTNAVVNNFNLYNHGVNNAQAFKSAAIWYRYKSTNETLRQLSMNRLIKMDEYHGQSTGMFAADEHLAGRMPSRGTETCDVVEYMWSFQVMFRVFGNVRYLDRLETIAVNALPATFGSPNGGDMWAHQYLQQNNEINSMFTNPHIWASDGPNATVYGLAPNYGCCTANFNQGWPKFAASVYSIVSDGIGIGVYAPSKTKGVVNGMASINITTNYPFEDDITININAQKAFNLYLRIPGWTNIGDVVLKLDNNQPIDPKTLNNGTMYKLPIPSSGSHIVQLNFNPKVRIYKGYNGSVSLLRGPILFSLPIKEQWEVVANYKFDSKDYWCLPQSKWNYALAIDDLNNIEKYVQVKTANWVTGHAPFNRTNIPIMLQVNAYELYTWGEIDNAAASPPQSPACANKANCNPTVTQLILVPHGTTDLRIAEWPLANTNY